VKKAAVYLVVFLLMGLSMSLSGQEFTHYIYFELIPSLGLVSLAWCCILSRQEAQSLKKLLRSCALNETEIQSLQILADKTWQLLWQVMAILFLFQSILMLTRVGSPEQSTSLGPWLALLLLGSLYLLLLRWWVFLPLELSLKRMQIKA